MARANAELAARGHLLPEWYRHEEYQGWIAMCPRCRCFTMVEPDGTAYGAGMLVPCVTLTEIYEASILRGDKARRAKLGDGTP